MPARKRTRDQEKKIFKEYFVILCIQKYKNIDFTGSYNPIGKAPSVTYAADAKKEPFWRIGRRGQPSSHSPVKGMDAGPVM